jgi:hypothetical protein
MGAAGAPLVVFGHLDVSDVVIGGVRARDAENGSTRGEA